MDEKIKEIEPDWVDFVRESVNLKCLKYCPKHKTVILPFNGLFPCCMEERIKELEKRLLEIHRQAGESCPNAPSPIDAYRILANRVKELEGGIKIFDNKAYREHCLAKTNSKCLTELLKLIEKECNHARLRQDD